MIIHNFEQHTDDWYNIRLGKFTASHADTIKTGKTGLETLCFNLVAEILTKKKKDTFLSAAMAQGNELEDTARTLFEMQTGLLVNQVGFVEVDEFSGCSPDGLIGDVSGVEIKCPQDNTFAKYLYDLKIKPEYYAQIQMQMMMCKRDYWYYAVFNPNFDEQLIVQKVDKDIAFQEHLSAGLDKGKARVREILEQIKKRWE